MVAVHARSTATDELCVSALRSNGILRKCPGSGYCILALSSYIQWLYPFRKKSNQARVPWSAIFFYYNDVLYLYHISQPALPASTTRLAFTSQPAFPPPP